MGWGELGESFEMDTRRPHLLAGHQENGAVLGVENLPEDVVEDEEFAPAVLQELHLVVNLPGEEERRG